MTYQINKPYDYVKVELLEKAIEKITKQREKITKQRETLKTYEKIARGFSETIQRKDLKHEHAIRELEREIKSLKASLAEAKETYH